MEAIRVQQETAELRVFAPDLRNGPDAPAVTATVPIGEWQTLELLLPGRAVSGILQIQPVNRPAVVEVSTISLRSPDGTIVWAAKTLPELQAVQTAGSLMLLPARDRCLFFSFGSDPIWLLPPLSEPVMAAALRIVIRVHHDCEAVSRSVSTAHAQVYEMAAQVRSASADRIKTVREFQRRAEAAMADCGEQVKMAAQLADNRIAEIQKQNRILESRLNTLTAEHEDLRQSLLIMEQSRSWRLTRPLRSASTLAQKLKKSFD